MSARKTVSGSHRRHPRHPIVDRATKSGADPNYLSLYGGRGEYFAAVHHWDGTRLAITVQTFERPDVPVGQIEVTGWVPALTGAEAIWSMVPSVYVGYLNDAATGAAGYFVVRRSGRRAELSRLDWFDGANYDLGYQGVVSATVVPGTAETLFGVQRSSKLVLVDPEFRGVVRRIELAGRGGNPHPRFSTGGDVVWAVDYDTVVRLDPRTWNVMRSALLQPTQTGPRMFVGDVWLPASETYLVIPRPGSGDVLIVDPLDLAISSTLALGDQPLEAAVIGEDLLIARDWKTGRLLTMEVGTAR